MSFSPANTSKSTWIKMVQDAKRLAGGALEVNLGNSLCAQARDPSRLWKPGQTSQVQNRGTSGPTKRTYVLQNILKQKKKKKWTKRYTCLSSISCWAIICFLWGFLLAMFLVDCHLDAKFYTNFSNNICLCLSWTLFIMSFDLLDISKI